jgi:hypothetical protein
MKSNRNTMCGIFGLALLALSFNVGGSAVRAEDSPLQTSMFEPIAKMVQGLEERMASLESTVMAFAGSFTSEHITTTELCVSDEGGAKTCITKAQLDKLLKLQVQLGAAEEHPADHASVTEAPAQMPQQAAEQAPAQVEAMAPPAVGPVAAVVAEVTVTTTIAVPGEAAQKDEEITTGALPAETHASAPEAVTEEKATSDSVQ